MTPGGRVAHLTRVEGEAAPAQCAAGRADDIATLLAADGRMQRMALEYAEYYAGMLREPGGQSAECLAR